MIFRFNARNLKSSRPGRNGFNGPIERDRSQKNERPTDRPDEKQRSTQQNDGRDFERHENHQIVRVGRLFQAKGQLYSGERNWCFEENCLLERSHDFPLGISIHFSKTLFSVHFNKAFRL